MGIAPRAAGAALEKFLAFGTAFNVGDVSQGLINDRLFETFSDSFSVQQNRDALVCNKAGKYLVRYTGNGSYVTAEIQKNGGAFFSKTFDVRGPRVTGTVSIDLEAGDTITCMVTTLVAHGGTVSFSIARE